MNDLPGMRDEDIDRLLSGKVPEGDGIDDLAAFVRGVQATYVAPPGGDAARSHIAAAAAAAREVAASGAAVAGPGVPVQVPTLPTRWRRRTAFGVSVATMTLSISAAAIAATGGLAAKGDLPGPVQRVVSHAASGVGISWPSGASGSGSSGSGSGSNLGGPSSGSRSGGSGPSHQVQAGPSPTPSGTSGRRGHDDFSQSGGVGVLPTPSHDRQGGRGRDDASSGVGGSTTTMPAGHGRCVTYAEQIAGTIGLSDAQRSTFVSLVDHDPSAVTDPVIAGGKPDAACQSSINTAKASAAASSGGSDDHSVFGPGRSPSPSTEHIGHGGSEN
jgi:hypothetical protein